MLQRRSLLLVIQSPVPVGVPDEQDHFMEFETQLCVKAVIEGFPASDCKLRNQRKAESRSFLQPIKKILSVKMAR